ncbi:juvenile hormone acid O-methyltransferase isoform X2 [Uranotaenia lowii]|uniref:juvenile hormone acid O-methyltransferase isoform X2 n=1 Tax=Uranotaenia lowii TaxID=190385 RepID=UPI00247A7B64|nr:juvenile hormone acid O-methyltransferase isoform X2 [Uranotaenia lowii]
MIVFLDSAVEEDKCILPVEIMTTRTAGVVVDRGLDRIGEASTKAQSVAFVVFSVTFVRIVVEDDKDTPVSEGFNFKRKALSNIRNLLAEGGECLLVFLACNPIYDIFYELSRHPKWAPYMTNVEKFISPYQYSSNPTEDINKQLTHVGFSFHSVKVLDKIYIYEGEECMRNAVKAVNPFREQMLPDVQEDFMNDYVDVVRRMLVSPDNKCDDNNYSVITPYKLAIIYAKK